MNITLIGMAGVGKSVIGKELARALHYEFVDTDDLIERKLNLKLQEIIDQLGEGRFLEIEQEAILELNGIDRTIVSPGGSVIYSLEAMRFLKKISTVIFLDAPVGSIEKRIPNQSVRGIVGLKKKRLKDLFDERRPLYQQYADITVEMAEGFDREVVLKEIIQKVLENSQI